MASLNYCCLYNSLLLFLSLTSQCFCQYIWTPVNPKNYYCENICSICYGNNQYVVVGRGDRSYTSTEGSTWISHSTINGLSHQNWLSDVCYGNHYYIAVGSGYNKEIGNYYGIISETTDFEQWHTVPVPDFPSLNAIAYIDSLFCVVGNNGYILTSVDGINWTNRNIDTSYNLLSICYGNGKYVAAGTSGIILTSFDGSVWLKQHTNDTTEIRSISFGNDLFAAVGGSSKIFTSSDGIEWNKNNLNISFNLQAITYGNGSFIAVGDSGTIVISTIGNTWNIVNSNTTTMFKDVIYHNNQFVTIGDSARIYGRIFISQPDTSLVTQFNSFDHTFPQIITNINNLSQSISIQFSSASIFDNFSIQMHMLSGKQVSTVTNYFNRRILNIPIEDLTNGTYIISICSNNNLLSTKIINLVR